MTMSAWPVVYYPKQAVDTFVALHIVWHFGVSFKLKSDLTALSLVKNTLCLEGFDLFQRLLKTAPPSALHGYIRVKYKKILSNCLRLARS